MELKHRCGSLGDEATKPCPWATFADAARRWNRMHRAGPSRNAATKNGPWAAFASRKNFQKKRRVPSAVFEIEQPPGNWVPQKNSRGVNVGGIKINRR
jgi:hypothetical protein